MDITQLVYINETGYFFADYPTFLVFRQDQYKVIYGSDIYLGPESQDGQLTAIQAKADYDTAALGASVYNSFSPVTAQGIGLSRNVKINGLRRRAATFSTVDLVIVGTVGTLITSGIAIDTINQKWKIPDLTIPSGGTITITASAEFMGAVQAVSNSVNRIFTPTRGWQTVNNPDPATAGVPVETNAELRARQAQSTANPSLTVLEGTQGAVANITGVTNTKAYENDTNATDVNGIPAHSVAIVVSGGDTTEIAEVIALHKTPGTGTFGTTSVLVTDSRGMPLNIAFSRPTVVTITVTVTLSAYSGYSADYSDQIKIAVAAVINALDIGSDVLITKLYYPAYLNNSVASETYDITTIEIGRDADPQAPDNIEIEWNEIANCDPNTDITVVVT